MNVQTGEYHGASPTYVRIERYEIVEGDDKFVRFPIQVLTPNRSWHIAYRFKAFERLHKSLLKKFPDSLPEFPPKFLFGNFTPERLNQRRIHLCTYLNHLIESPITRQSEELMTFLLLRPSDLFVTPTPPIRASQRVLGSASASSATVLGALSRVKSVPDFIKEEVEAGLTQVTNQSSPVRKPATSVGSLDGSGAGLSRVEREGGNAETVARLQAKYQQRFGQISSASSSPTDFHYSPTHEERTASSQLSRASMISPTTAAPQREELTGPQMRRAHRMSMISPVTDGPKHGQYQRFTSPPGTRSGRTGALSPQRGYRKSTRGSSAAAGNTLISPRGRGSNDQPILPPSIVPPSLSSTPDGGSEADERRGSGAELEHNFVHLAQSDGEGKLSGEEMTLSDWVTDAAIVPRDDRTSSLVVESGQPEAPSRSHAQQKSERGSGHVVDEHVGDSGEYSRGGKGSDRQVSPAVAMKIEGAISAWMSDGEEKRNFTPRSTGRGSGNMREEILVSTHGGIESLRESVATPLESFDSNQDREEDLSFTRKGEGDMHGKTEPMQEGGEGGETRNEFFADDQASRECVEEDVTAVVEEVGLNVDDEVNVNDGNDISQPNTTEVDDEEEKCVASGVLRSLENVRERETAIAGGEMVENGEEKGQEGQEEGGEKDLKQKGKQREEDFVENKDSDFKLELRKDTESNVSIEADVGDESAGVKRRKKRISSAEEQIILETAKRYRQNRESARAIGEAERRKRATGAARGWKGLLLRFVVLIIVIYIVRAFGLTSFFQKD